MLTSATLTELYGAPIEVVRVRRPHPGGGHSARPPSTPTITTTTGRGLGAMSTGVAAATDVWHQIFNFDNYGELLALVHNSLIAGAVLGLVGGLISIFVMMRDLPFAVHGISELSFAGATGFLLLGANVVVGLHSPVRSWPPW